MIAAPVLQRNHRFINPAVIEWLDIHYGDTSFNGRVFIGHRKHGGGVYTMTARSLTEVQNYVKLIHVSTRLDYYITANTVSGVSRTVDGLFGLQNIVIDIDCHDDGQSDTAGLVQAFLWRAERDLWSDGDLPRPNSIVRTGRGVQLWWAIEPCHASFVFLYNQVKTGLMDHIDGLLSEYSELEGLEVDRTASSNAVGYFRMPCTYNTAAKRFSTLKVLHKARYDIQKLSEYISPMPEKKRSERIVGPQKAIPFLKSDVKLLRSVVAAGAKRIMSLIKLRSLRNNEVGSETRNNLCFSFYNALRMSCDHEEAKAHLKEFNSGFKQPMTDAELENTISAAVRKEGYQYTNAKLIEFLNITEEEQDAIGLHPVRGKFNRKYAKPNAGRDAVRRELRRDRDNKIIAMHQEGISQAETARKLGINRKTVAAVIKDWMAAVKEFVEEKRKTENEGEVCPKTVLNMLITKVRHGVSCPPVTDSGGMEEEFDLLGVASRSGP